MKKLLLSVLFGAAVAGASYAQPGLTPRRQPRLPQAVPTTAARVTSNPNFRLLTSLWQQYRNNAWLDTVRRSYSRFTAASLPRLEVLESTPTRGAALRPLRQERYQYNAAGKRLSDSTHVYTNGVPNATPTLLTTYTYDAQGRLTQELVSDYSAGTPRPYSRDTYTYNALGQNTRILNESYFGSSWLAEYQLLYTYNAQGQLTVDELQAADSNGTSFSPLVRDLFTYNAQGLMLIDLQQVYGTSAYADSYRITNSYNATNLLTGFVIEQISGGVWRPYAQYINTYDVDGNLMQQLRQRYRNGAYADDVRFQYTYQRVLATAAARRLQADLQVLPNPVVTTEPATVAYHWAQPTVTTLQVLDALGRVVATPVRGLLQPAGEQRLTLPAQLPAGLYTLRLQAGNASQTQKLLVR